MSQPIFMSENTEPENTEEAESRVGQLRIVRKGQSRYLVNESHSPIGRLRYSTAAFGKNYVSSVPTYEIESIPARSGVKIEEVDRYEDGLIMWQIGEVDWEDGTEYRGTMKLTEKKGTAVNWSSVEREKIEIGEPTPPQKIDDEGEE
ncbi:hypothetical protein GGP57_003237 [Salinibacter ruber]|uniref:hypothetical protein n=2 Tax=Salinibacter ruber TaxID=146919 RepID=UPI002168E00D|nr:hypothetical protein [Salinibacter ruber]MCS3635892.1 hypothetical protein [Salinibacter ruber]MCS3715433.1 hypothetical protein [Salinibacter ruber]